MEDSKQSLNYEEKVDLQPSPPVKSLTSNSSDISFIDESFEIVWKIQKTKMTQTCSTINRTANIMHCLDQETIEFNGNIENICKEN